MQDSAALDGRYLLLAGSISASTERRVVDRAHAFTATFVEEVANAGGGFVIYVSAEPVNSEQQPLTFDWGIARAVDRLFPEETDRPRLKIVVSQQRLEAKASTEQQRLIGGMVARNVAELIYLEDEIVTGGNVGDEQIKLASAMVALGGGKGVLDRARKMARARMPVLPLDLQLGGQCEDGTGAMGVLAAFRTNPLTYMPNTGTEVLKRLPAISLQNSVLSDSAISQRIVRILQEEEHARLTSLPPDVLVLTALSVELAAAKMALGIGDDVAPTTTAIGLHIWRAPVARRAGRDANCVLACFAGPGNLDASSITSTLLAELKPANVLMMGIAAGIRGKCKLAQVVLGERVVAYGGAAMLEGGKVENRPEISRPTLGVRQDVASYLSSQSAIEARLSDLYQRMAIEIPATAEAGAVVDSIGPQSATIASGEWLLRDPEKFMAMREIHGKIEVAEMEAAGVFSACETHSKPVIIVRGISDFGDAKKDNRFHGIAAKAAAAVSVDYIANGMTLAD